MMFQLQLTPQQTTPGMIIPLFIFIPLLIVIVLVTMYIVQKVVKTRLANATEPFEHGEKRTIVHLLKTSPFKTRLIAASIIILVAVSGITVIGQMPVNRTNIQHSDPAGDVADPNIDIVLIKSYLNGTDLYLQMTVAGEIVETNSTVGYQYKLIIVAKGLSEDAHAHIYALSYDNGSMEISSASAHPYVNGSTLTIVVPISILVQGDYMIGLEGAAMGLGADYTTEDRDGQVAHLWF
jgi:hypothetical protein